MKTLRYAAMMLAAVGGIVLALTFGMPRGSAQTGSPTAPDRARVVDAFGTVERRIGDGDSITWKTVSVGDLLTPLTTMRTGEGSAALLQLPGEHLLRVGAKTTLVLKQLGKDKQFSFQVVAGQIWSMVRKANHPAKYEVDTPSAVAGVTGTIFSVALDDKSGDAVVTTDDGSVNVRRPDGSAPALAVTRGMFARFGGRHAGGFGGPVSARRMGPEMHQMWQLRREGAMTRAADGRDSKYRPHLERFLGSRLNHGWRLGAGLDQQPEGVRRMNPAARAAREKKIGQMQDEQARTAARTIERMREGSRRAPAGRDGANLPPRGADEQIRRREESRTERTHQ